jgi:hypothetical protein
MLLHLSYRVGKSTYIILLLSAFIYSSSIFSHDMQIKSNEMRNGIVTNNIGGV